MPEPNSPSFTMNDFSRAASIREVPEPFPRRILCARSPHRLPRLPEHEELIAELLHHSINASAFVMDGDLIKKFSWPGFTNDPKLALADLEKQLRELDPSLGERLFPTPPKRSVTEELQERLQKRYGSSATSSASSSEGAQNEDSLERGSFSPPQKHSRFPLQRPKDEHEIG